MQMVGFLLDNFGESLKKVGRSRVLEKRLQAYSRFVMIVHKNLSLLVKYLFVVFVGCCITVIVSIILNIYILIEFGDYDGYILFFLEFQTVVGIGRLVAMFVTAEKYLNCKVSDKRYLLSCHYVLLTS